MKIIKQTKTQKNNEIFLIEENENTGNKTILVIGAVHGDEPQGKILIENYLNDSSNREDKNQMLYIPCLNPDGLELNTRKNASGVDLNRNFPTKNWALDSLTSDYYGGGEPASEIETKFLVDVIDEYKPNVILTIHAPFKIVNYDGHAAEIAEEISNIIGYPTQNDIGYPTPGSFGTYAGIERNIPTITLELDEDAKMQTLVKPFARIMNYLVNL